MKNKKKILMFQVFSIIFTMILGTLLHFTYEWSNYNSFVALFSAVNESTWEHLKLLFFPMLLTTIIGYFYIGKNIPNFLCSKLIGIVTSILFTIIFFYTYTGILGTNISFIDISIFFIAVLLGEYTTYKFLLSDSSCNKRVSIIVLTILLISFFLFTFVPPKIGLFKDPIVNDFGITKNRIES